jgi:adenylate cyclase
MKKIKFLLPVLLLILFGLALHIDLFHRIDNFIYDAFLAQERRPSEEIIIVGIDERSINEIGAWPWPRFYVADAIEKITEMGAAAIGVSILYDAYSADEYSDERLVAAAANTDRLIFAAMGIFPDHTRDELNAEDYIEPFEMLGNVARTGFWNVMPDESDGVMRRALTAFRYGDITVRSLPYEVYRTYTGAMGIQANEIPLDRLGKFPVNYATRPGGFPKVSLWGVINDEYSPALFENKIVLIGPYAQGLGSAYTTPLDRRNAMHSVEINANVIQNMLEGNFKQDSEWWVDLAAIAALGLLVIIFLHRLKPVWAALFVIALIAIQLFSSVIAWLQFDLILRPSGGAVFLLLCFIAHLAFSIYMAQHEKQHIQGMFGRFVAPEVVKELVSGGVEIQLGGTEREVTLIFVDIRGFTAFSEANPPEKVVNMVNRYLGLTSRAIQENGGTIDKFIGDATMAVFNAPNHVPDHALRACKAAWAMKQGSVALREEIMRDYGVDLQFGVGINTGPAVVGNMGSDFRMDYTAIGDTVNTAARLEANAEKGQIIISDATYQIVKDHVEVTDLGVLNVKNKQIGIQIYNLESMK